MVIFHSYVKLLEGMLGHVRHEMSQPCLNMTWLGNPHEVTLEMMAAQDWDPTAPKATTAVGL